MTTRDDVLRELDAYVSETTDAAVSAQRASDQTTIDALNGQIGSINQTLATVQADDAKQINLVNTLTSQVADLQARLALLDPAYVPGWGAPTWRDDFDGTKLDTTKWATRYTKGQTINTDSDGWFDPANCFLDGQGNLILRSVKATPPAGSQAATQGRTWSTSYLWSSGKFSARYGRWDVRMMSLKPLVSRGMWVGPWFRDDNGEGEADLSESVGTHCAHPGSYPDDGSASSSTFYTVTGSNSATIGSTRTDNTLWKYKPNADGTYYGWHNLTFEWTPNRMTTYADGIKRLEITRDTAVGRSVLDVGFPTTAHIRLTQHVGSDWAGHPDATNVTPYDTKIDYVRYYPYNGQV